MSGFKGEGEGNPCCIRHPALRQVMIERTEEYVQLEVTVPVQAVHEPITKRIERTVKMQVISECMIKRKYNQ